jgi:glucose/arabinose dehydrogenase
MTKKPDIPLTTRALGVALGVAVVMGACSEGSDVLSPSTGSAPDTGELLPSDPLTDESGVADSAGDGSGDPGAATGGPLVWPETPFSLAPVVTLDQPIALVTRSGSSHLWLAERTGQVRLVERSVDGAGTEEFQLVDQPVVDLSDLITTEGEGGLLGIVFSDDGERLYIHYTDSGGDNVVSEVPMGETTADLDQERILLQVPQPYSNHNGGDLTIGPDGMLYISLGDGGSGGDPGNHGQNPATLLGTILRIDPSPDGSQAYTIPDDNPFVDAGDGSRGEVWAWGLRNPWRFSFDATLGDLWIADVGQAMYEEVNVLLDEGKGPGWGANLGWNLMEGYESFSGPAPEGHVAPVYVYDHSNGRCSITGGYVYRGQALAELDGVYLYSDYCSGEITGLQLDGGELLVANLQLDYQPRTVISFGQGPDGEIYVLEQGGLVSRLQPSG